MKVDTCKIIWYSQCSVYLSSHHHHIMIKSVIYNTLQASLVVQMVKNPPAMQATWVRSLGWENPLEEGMATHSSILAWRIPMEQRAWLATVYDVAKTKHIILFTTHIKLWHNIFKHSYMHYKNRVYQ